MNSCFIMGVGCSHAVLMQMDGPWIDDLRKHPQNKYVIAHKDTCGLIVRDVNGLYHGVLRQSYFRVKWKPDGTQHVVPGDCLMHHIEGKDWHSLLENRTYWTLGYGQSTIDSING
ncbi:MAG: hypothetical protein K0U52_01000 [Gammaproteobacteria bacterium]|nr:hypothetical protein [Gammaproteobacteria bacterium]